MSSQIIGSVIGGAAIAGAVALISLVGCWSLSGPSTALARKPQQIRRPVEEAPPPVPLPPTVVEQPPAQPKAVPPAVAQQPQAGQQQQVPHSLNNLVRPDPQQGQAFQVEHQDEPATKHHLLSEADEKKATSKLYLAKKFDKEGKVRLANKLCQEIIEKFPGSSAAGEAQQLAGYSLDKRVERAAKSLTTAQGLELGGSLTDAKGVYQEIILLYPDTEQAEVARQRLKAISNNK
jgi:TolA-binding protein